LAVLYFTPAAHTDQPSSDTIGAIDGQAISVSGPMSVDVVDGQMKTVLRSGSDIRVNSGQAHIELVEGGQVSICGPAHLSVLKSTGFLTLALDTGIIHAHIEHAPALTIYTAQLQAKSIPIGDLPEDMLVGFDPTGAMCIRAQSGAIRVEQQLASQNIVIPQGGDVLISNGQLETLRNVEGHCACELPLAKSPPPLTEISRLASPQEIEKSKTELKPLADAPKPAAKEEPIYQVFMPPLSYDSTAKEQRDNFDPQLIVLVRRVRVRPTLVFQGTVKDAPATEKTAQRSVAPTSVAMTAQRIEQAPQKNPVTPTSTIDRVRAWFRKLLS
jgi:hypothetical protein